MESLVAILASISVRALLLAGIGALTLWVLRVKISAIKHAVWSVVVAGMMLGGMLTTLLPPVPIRVLRPIPRQTSRPAPLPVSAGALTSLPPFERSGRPVWQWAALSTYAIVTLVLLSRLAVGCLFVRRLLRAAEPVGRLGCLKSSCFESSWISVPMTVGWMRPKILLPVSWRQWSPPKLESVLAHEEAHVRRADWVIGIMARLNRCMFWFHPLAWWLDRHIAALAEQACDDSALAVVADRQQYAEALLDMARAVRLSEGRLMWHAIAMAKGVQVAKRIDRILDETRPVPRVAGRTLWAALLMGSLPILYVASTARLTAQAPSGPGRASETKLDPRWQQWLDVDTAYIMTHEERRAFILLKTDEEREQFTEQFWSRRDPTPGTSANEFKDEHYRRIAYANDHYSTATIPGWASDRGRNYILFGPADELESHPQGRIANPSPSEAWRYRYIEGIGANATFLFTDPDHTGAYSLTLDQTEVVYRIGAGVTPPSVVQKREPGYTAAARAAKLQGTTVLSVVVGTTGFPYNISVVQSLDAGLDQKAIEAVREWRFRPGQKDGQPVPVTARIEINFRLL